MQQVAVFKGQGRNALLFFQRWILPPGPDFFVGGVILNGRPGSGEGRDGGSSMTVAGAGLVEGAAS